MLARTHLAFGIAVGILLVGMINPASVLFFFFGLLLGTLIVDIDQPNSKLGSKLKPFTDIFSLLFGHRGFFHSLFSAVLFSGVAWYFLDREFGLGILVGYVSHILLDGLTESGVNLLHPVTNLRISGFVKTGGLIEHLMLIGIIVFIVVKIF
jgi:inner membrane protein